MIARCLAFAFGIWFVHDHSFGEEGAVLASLVAPEKATSKGLCQAVLNSHFGQEETKEATRGTGSTAVAPHVEFSRDLTAHSRQDQNDLVLPSMQNSEWPEIRYMPRLSRSLEHGVEGTSEQTTIPQQKQNSQASRAARTAKPCHPRLAGVSQSSPMDTDNASDKASCSASGHSSRNAEQRVWTEASTSSNFSKYAFQGGTAYGRGEEKADSFAWLKDDGCAASKGVGRSVDGVGGKGDRNEQLQSLVTWTSQSFDKDQNTDQCTVKKDSCARSRVECFCAKHHAEGFPTCGALSAVPGRNDGAVQSEARGTPEVEVRTHFGIQKPRRSACRGTTAGGFRACGSADGQDANSPSCRRISGESPGVVRRGRRDDHGRRGGGNYQRQQNNLEIQFQGSSISTKGGAIAFEDEEGQTGEMRCVWDGLVKRHSTGFSNCHNEHTISRSSDGSPSMDSRAAVHASELSHMTPAPGHFAQHWRETMNKWWNADRGWLRVAKHNDAAFLDDPMDTQSQNFTQGIQTALKCNIHDFSYDSNDDGGQGASDWHRRFEPHFDDGALLGCSYISGTTHCLGEPELSSKIEEQSFESSGLKGSHKKVTFQDKVHVVCFQDDEACETVLHIEQCEAWLRNVWHLHGQIMAWPALISYMTSAFFHDFHTVEHTQHGQESPSTQKGRGVPSSSCSAMITSQVGMPEIASDWHQQWQLAMQSWTEQERVVTGRYIITWFLARGRAHVCVQHRRVRIEEGMTATEFCQACRATWWDLWEQEDSSFHFVHPKPPGLPSTLAHVIIVQGDCQSYNAVLYHGEALPALRRQRAVLYKEGICVQQFYVAAQHPEACRVRNSRCFIQFDVEDQHTLLCDEDLMHVPIATLVKGTIRVIDEENDNDGTATESGDEGSVVTTAIPDDHIDEISDVSEDAEGEQSSVVPRESLWSWEGHQHIDMPFEHDECSWMSASPARWQFEHPDPYPWQIEPLALEEEQEEEEIDTVFGEQHLHFLQEYVDQALSGSEDEGTTWQAITYGIGLLDLGRRDFPFHPWNLQQLPQLVQQAWWDHAQYGALTIFFVFPQPGEAPNTITLLVRVASPDDLNPDVRNLLITQKGDKKAGLRPVSYGAKVLTGSTSRELLVQLGIHKKCRPFTMRHCEIRLGTEVMQDDVRYHFDHGLWCCPTIGKLPHHVAANMERVEQVEAFYLQVEDFFAMRPEESSVVCHVHGVSPENRPMGHRTLVIHKNDLQGDEWIEKMWQLWPFDHPYSPIIFCPYAIPDMRECKEMIFHFAVDYGSQDGVTVLVQQEIQVVDDVPKGKKAAQEFWAVVMPHGEISEDRLEVLNKGPFWKRYADKNNLRLHMSINGERYHEVPGPWNDGGCSDNQDQCWPG